MLLIMVTCRFIGGTNDRPLSENVFDVVFDYFADIYSGIWRRRSCWAVSLPPRFSVRHILECIPLPLPVSSDLLIVDVLWSRKRLAECLSPRLRPQPSLNAC